MTTGSTIAFVFATSMEADPFIARVNASQTKKYPMPIYRTTISGQPIIIIISGMGMAQAKTATEFVINHYAVNLIFNCGVAGSLTDVFDIGDILNITRSFIFKDDNIQDDVCNLTANSPGIDVYPDGVLLTVDRPVFDQDKKSSLTGIAQLVDMEGGIVARVCTQNNIPCQLIKIISDYSVKRNQLKKNLCSVSNKLADRIMSDIVCLFSQEKIA